MITIDQKGRLIFINALGEFTLADFKELEDAILSRTKSAKPMRLLVDLTEMAGFTVDMVWEELRFSRAHGNDFDRIAVVTDSQWVAWSAWLEQLFVNADLRVFDDRTEAGEWIEEAGG